MSAETKEDKYRRAFAGAGRKAVSLGLGAMLVAGMTCAPAVSALASVGDNNATGDGTPGNVQINKTEGNSDTTYRAIKVFNATVQPTKTKKANDADGHPATAAPRGENTDSNLTKEGTYYKSGEVKDVQWPSENVHKIVENVLRYGTAEPGDAKNEVQWNSETYTQFCNNAHTTVADSTAQDAAEFIAKHITDNGGGSANSGYVLASGELGNLLADALQNVAETYPGTNQTFKPGEQLKFTDGYYLVVTKTDSVKGKTDHHGTSPIFLAAGGDDVTITEKVNEYPKVEKFHMDDSANITNVTADSLDSKDWKKSAVASQIGQWIPYKVTATLPTNFKTYKTYKMVFHDSLSKGLTADKDSVKVWVFNGTTWTEVDKAKSGVSVTDAAAKEMKSVVKDGNAEQKTAGYTDAHELTTSIPDLKALKDEKGTAIPVDDKSVIATTYDAQINSTAVWGAGGNPNTVRIEYSNNPNTDSTGYTDYMRTYDFSYAVALHKQDKNTNQNLAGAKFTIQATGADDAESGNKYVQADGTLGDKAYEFATDASGNILVHGLDEGTYTLHEVQAPSGYNQVPDSKFTIDATYDENYDGTAANENQQTALSAPSIEDGYDAFSGQLVYQGIGDSQDKAPVDANAGEVRVTAEDVKTVDMPFTGQQGLTLLFVAGLGIVGVSTAALIRRSRRRAEDASVGNGPAAA